MNSALKLEQLTKDNVFTHNLYLSKKKHLSWQDSNQTNFEFKIQPVESSFLKHGLHFEATLGNDPVSLSFDINSLSNWLRIDETPLPTDLLPSEILQTFVTEMMAPWQEYFKYYLGESVSLVNRIENTQDYDEKPVPMLCYFSFAHTSLLFTVGLPNTNFFQKLPNNYQKSSKLTLGATTHVGKTYLSKQDLTSLNQEDILFFDETYLAENNCILLINKIPTWKASITSEASITLTERLQSDFFKDINDMSNQPNTLNNYNDIPVAINFEVGNKEFSLDELYTLNEGYIIELDRDIHQPILIKTNNQTIGYGELVDVESRLGVKVKKLYAKGESPAQFSENNQTVDLISEHSPEFDNASSPDTEIPAETANIESTNTEQETSVISEEHNDVENNVKFNNETTLNPISELDNKDKITDTSEISNDANLSNTSELTINQDSEINNTSELDHASNILTEDNIHTSMDSEINMDSDPHQETNNQLYSNYIDTSSDMTSITSDNTDNTDNTQSMLDHSELNNDYTAFNESDNSESNFANKRNRSLFDDNSLELDENEVDYNDIFNDIDSNEFTNEEVHSSLFNDEDDILTSNQTDTFFNETLDNNKTL